MVKEYKWLNRLAKWRTVYASWFFGTRLDTDEQVKCSKDIIERMLILRAETTVILGILVDKGLITSDEFVERLENEAKLACSDLEKRFPGFKTSDFGVDIDLNLAKDTTKGWPK